MVELLESELEDVLVNAVNAIRVLCEGNPDNQTEVARNGECNIELNYANTITMNYYKYYEK